MENTNAMASQNDATNDFTSSASTKQPATDTATTSQEGPNINDLTDDEAINMFIYSIMEEKGTATGSEQVQDSIFNDLKTKLLQEIDRSLIAELPDDKLDELNKMATEKGQIDPNIIANMIEQANLDIADIIGGTMARFRELYLGNNPDASEAQPIEEAK